MTIAELEAAERTVGGQWRLGLLASVTPRTLQLWKTKGVVPHKAATRIRALVRIPGGGRNAYRPRWFVPPRALCTEVTREVMDIAQTHGLIMVKRDDGKRLGLSHSSRGVIHSVENTDQGRVRLVEWMRANCGKQGDVNGG